VSILKPGQVYLAHDRFLCSACAGFTASATGSTTEGVPLLVVGSTEVEAWATYDLGPLACECGKAVAL
jgi:hypothetical protein